MRLLVILRMDCSPSTAFLPDFAQMCAFDFIVDNNKHLLNFGRRVLGRRLFNKLMKATIYGQFVGGEDKKDIQGTISKNMAFGVKSILDYSAEEDMTSAKVGLPGGILSFGVS